MQPVVGAVVADRYQLRRQLGEGGMASVWEAYDRSEDAAVALKFMGAEYSSSDLAKLRFEREALAASQAKHPHIVNVQGHGVHGGTPFIVMELLEGEDLLKRIRREGRTSLEGAARLLSQIADGLHHAHTLGITHRDLKPGNIFMARVGEAEIPKIVDFGIAKAKHTGTDEEATRPDTVLGSFNYISPEQLKSSKDVDHRSDLWSLGVILFRLVTGKLPFTGNDHVELVAKICIGSIPVPSEVAPELDLSREVDAFFRRALDREKTRRFQTAMDMAEQFRRVVRGLPEAPHDSTEPLSPKSSPRPRNRDEVTAERTRADMKIASALRQAPVEEAQELASSFEIGDGQMLQVVYHGSESPTRITSAREARSTSASMATTLVKETPNVPSGALVHPAELKADEDSQETVSTFLKVDDDVSEIAAKPIRSQEEASGATRSSSEDSEAYVTTHLKIDVELSSTVYKEDTKGPETLPAANTSLGHRAPQTQPRDRKLLILVVVGVVMVAAASVVVLGAWSH